MSPIKFLTVLDACPDRIAHLLAHLKQLLLLPNENNDDMELTSLKRHCIALLLRITQSLSDSTKVKAAVPLSFNSKFKSLNLALRKRHFCCC